MNNNPGRERKRGRDEISASEAELKQGDQGDETPVETDSSSGPGSARSSDRPPANEATGLGVGPGQAAALPTNPLGVVPPSMQVLQSLNALATAGRGALMNLNANPLAGLTANQDAQRQLLGLGGGLLTASQQGQQQRENLILQLLTSQHQQPASAFPMGGAQNNNLLLNLQQLLAAQHQPQRQPVLQPLLGRQQLLEGLLTGQPQQAALLQQQIQQYQEQQQQQQQQQRIQQLLGGSGLGLQGLLQLAGGGGVPPSLAQILQETQTQQAVRGTGSIQESLGDRTSREEAPGSASSASLSPSAPPVPVPAVVTQPKLVGRDPVVLYVGSDDESLSPYQCLTRQQMHLFEAKQIDVDAGAQGRNKPIVLGQVGIRCKWCAHMPLKQRLRASTYYPAKLSGLYQAAQNITNGHLCNDCKSLPEDVRAELMKLQTKKSAPGGGKHYWSQGASSLGVFEDVHGLRFKPNDAASSEEPHKDDRAQDGDTKKPSDEDSGK